jgi:hypothetical protein
MPINGLEPEHVAYARYKSLQTENRRMRQQLIAFKEQTHSLTLENENLRDICCQFVNMIADSEIE